MGTSTSAAQLGMKFQSAATMVPRSIQAGINQSSLTVKEIFVEGAAIAGVHPGSKLPRHTNRGWRVRYTIKQLAAQTESLVRYLGPLHWFEGGTIGHMIEPKARRAGEALQFPDGQIRNAVFHPGMMARPFWNVTKVRALAAVPKTMSAAYRSGLLQTFR